MLRWLVQHGLIVIPKATSVDHIRENMDIFGWELSKQDMAAIDGLGIHQRMIRPDFAEFDD